MVNVLHDACHIHTLALLLAQRIPGVYLDFLLDRDSGGDHLLQPTNDLTRVAKRLDLIGEDLEVGQTNVLIKTKLD